jgi:tetratricopeptide (TPR) repeat protein
MTRKMVFLMALALALPCPAPAQDAADSPERLLKQADQLEKEGKTAKAVDVYREFLGKHAGHSLGVEAHYRLGKALDALGYVDEVAEQLEAVINDKNVKYRNRPDAFYMLGKLHAGEKKYDKALPVFEKLLGEGAGLYEDEVLSLCAGYYAILGKYDDAGAKLNLLKRRKGSPLAEAAAHKLAVLWLKAEKLDLAVDAVEDLANSWPQNQEARGLMLQLADLFRKKQQYAKAIAACEQVRKRYATSVEAKAVGFVIGQCYKDRKEWSNAVAAFDDVARHLENRQSGLAAEAMLESAEIFLSRLEDPKRAMERYEETASLARTGKAERKAQILELAYFRLGEYYFSQKKWSIALEYYALMRKLDTKINILPRMLKCQTELEMDLGASLRSDQDIEYLKKKIQDNAGTFAAAEGEVFLVDMKLNKALEGRGPTAKYVEEYEAILGRYRKEVLGEQHLESYVYSRIGSAWAHEGTKEGLAKALTACERGLAVDGDTPYKIELLESVARAADLLGDKHKSFQTYQKLFELSSGDKTAKTGVKADEQERRMGEYLRSMLTRAEKTESIEQAIAVARDVIARKGAGSPAGRHAMFYIGELLYLKKGFSQAAAAYRDFIKAYGPPQNADGDLASAPWQPKSADEAVEQVYEASVRIAHCWYMQSHQQNMVKAYEWLARNVPYGNKYVAEAQYWLAMELVKGKKGEEPEAKRKAAERLWTKVVNSSFEFDGRTFREGFHPWVKTPDAERYVKSAILKAGQLYGEVDDHERAAGIFRSYLGLFPAPQEFLKTGRMPRRDGKGEPVDEGYGIARYALGLEYLKLGEIPKFVECYRVYVDVMREDKFRVSGLQLLAYHASKAEDSDAAVEAFSVLLDEFGANELDKNDRPIPVPLKDRLYQRRSSWDGIRRAPPPGLDLAEVRFALGFHYFKRENWAMAAKSLQDFFDNPQTFASKPRPKALYMLAQSYAKGRDHGRALEAIVRLVKDHPTFDAVEEAYVQGASAAGEAGQWRVLDQLYARFVKDHPQSTHRPHMDLYAALSTLRQGDAEKGVSLLASLARSDTFQDVKADAEYYLAVHLMSVAPPKHKEASERLAASLSVYPRERACLAAAQCALAMGRLSEAEALAERTIRGFPEGERKAIDEAKALLADVRKKLAASGGEKKK